MIYKKSSLWYAVGMCSVLLASGQARAGGLFLSEFGTQSMANASAGAEAAGLDASTALHNPAAMTRIDGSAVQLGVGAVIADIEFAPAPTTPVAGGNGGQAGVPGPILNLGVVYGLRDGVKLGLDVFAPAAAFIDYDEGWSGRYQALEVTFLALTVMPSIAVEVTDWLSIGVGGQLVFGTMSMEVAIPALIPAIPTDGRADLDKLTDFAGGFNLSALFEIDEATRIGLVYNSEVNLDLSGDVTLTLPIGIGASNVGIDTTMPLARTLSLGVFHQLNEHLALRGSIGWQDWGALDHQFIETDLVSGSLARGWSDTWFIALGADYQVTPRWLVSTGFRYDSSPVTASMRTADLAIDRQWRVGAGAQYAWRDTVGDTFDIGLLFEYANYGDAAIGDPNPQTGLIGVYDDYNLFFIALTFEWD